MVMVRQALVILVAGTLGYSGAAWGQALAGDPPGRVGRLAFTEGTVSFHDADRTDWRPAMINQPLTAGDAVWTEPNAHSEISIAGTRVRMDGATQLDMVNLDDQQTRLQLDQGRVDIKTLTFDARQPYELVTPRGVATLEQKGDYYVEAGSTQDPTRLGVRQGAAQFQAPDGRVLAVRAGEVAEMTGDGSSMELHTIQAPPPPMPQYWAARDRVVAYDQPPQYLSAGITGYEDLNYYGSWTRDPEYGQVWYARNVPSGWAPYTRGRWISDPVYGWTWVDDEPWGFAPYHYGRWAHRGERWFWVPPERSQPAVYAPALVAFVGGVELGQALSAQNRQPVGWFPLGPREVYVPPYTADRDYYRRVNLAARVENRILEDRWQRAQRREAIAEQNWANRRFATVVPAEAFARSQPVERAALRIDAQKLAAVPVAAVAVPPSPTVSVRAIQAPAALTGTAPNQTQPSTGSPTARTTTQAQPGATTTLQAHAVMQQAIKPEPQAQKAPGPQIATRAAAPTAPDQKPALPKLEPRNASAPPLPQIQGERKPATTQPGPQQATAPANQPTATPPKPGEPPKPGQPQANAPAGRPAVPPPPGEQNKAQPNQANLPPVPNRNEQRPEPPRPGQPQANIPPNAAPNAQPAKPGEPPKSPQATAPAPQPPKPGEPPKSPQATNTPQPPHQPEPPKPAQAAPQPQHPVTPPPAQQQLQRAPAPSAPPPPAQTHAAPPPPAQRHAAPPPPAQTHAAPPPQPQAPPPQQAHAPAPPPPPQPQHQAAPPPAPHPAPPPPQQAHAPAPPPPQHQAAPPPAPHPAPPPPQQAQAPHPAPAPAPAPAPQKPAPQGQKQDEKK